jgi:hypothetical protein
MLRKIWEWLFRRQFAEGVKYGIEISKKIKGK